MSVISRFFRLAIAPFSGFVKAFFATADLPRPNSYREMVRQDVARFFAPFVGAVKAFQAELKKR